MATFAGRSHAPYPVRRPHFFWRLEMDYEELGYFSVVETEILLDRSVAPNAKILFGIIRSLTRRDGYCWASNSYLAGLFGVSKSAVSGWIGQLEDRGYVRVEYERDGKQIKERRIYTARIPEPVQDSDGGSQKSEGGVQKSEEGYSEKTKEIIYNYNIHDDDTLVSQGETRGRTERKRERFAPSREFVEDICRKNNFTGKSGTPEGLAEWFCKVAVCPDGSLNYKGTPIRNCAGLVAVLRSVDVNGKAFRDAERRPVRATPGSARDAGVLF